MACCGKHDMAGVKKRHHGGQKRHDWCKSGMMGVKRHVGVSFIMGVGVIYLGCNIGIEKRMLGVAVVE